MSTDQTELDEFDDHEQTVVITTGQCSDIYHTDADCPQGPKDGHFERPLSWAQRHDYRECRHCSGEAADGEYGRHGDCALDGCSNSAIGENVPYCSRHVHRLAGSGG